MVTLTPKLARLAIAASEAHDNSQRPETPVQYAGAFVFDAAMAARFTYQDSAAEFEQAGVAVIAAMDSFLVAQYGVRCNEFEPDCCVCKAYQLRDQFKCHAVD